MTRIQPHRRSLPELLDDRGRLPEERPDRHTGLETGRRLLQPQHDVRRELLNLRNRRRERHKPRKTLEFAGLSSAGRASKNGLCPHRGIERWLCHPELITQLFCKGAFFSDTAPKTFSQPLRFAGRIKATCAYYMMVNKDPSKKSRASQKVLPTPLSQADASYFSKTIRCTSPNRLTASLRRSPRTAPAKECLSKQN